MNKPQHNISHETGFKQTNKVAFKFSNNAAKFLNGITTNTPDKETTAFLDRFGKLIAFAHQLTIDDTIYILIEKNFENNFTEHIDSYIKFTKTKMDKMIQPVLHIIGTDNIGSIHFPESLGYYTLAYKADIKEISEEDYNRIRIENNIPIQGIDFNNEMFLSLGLTSAISFEKGCYLGQEVMARVDSMGQANRKIVRILYKKKPEKVTSKGEQIGKITSYCFSKKYNKYICFALIQNKEVDNGEIISS